MRETSWRAPQCRVGFAILVAVALAMGCTASQRAVRVTVTTPAGAGVGGAVVAWVCEPSGDAGTVTNASGAADVAIFNSDPKQCVVTVAKPGFHTQQLHVEELARPVTVELREIDR